MKYLAKTIEYGLYLLVFLLPWQTRWIIKAGQLNNGPWEYGTYSLYGTDVLLLMILALFIVREIASSQSLLAMTMKKDRNGRIIWWFIGGLILVSAVSVLGAADKLLALYKFGWLILGVSLFWLITSANYNRLKLIYALLAGAFFSAGLGIWQFLNQAAFANKWLGLAMHKGADLGAAVVLAIGSDGIGERWLRAYGSLDHPNMLGGTLVVVTLLLIGNMLKINYDDKIPLTPARKASLAIAGGPFVKGGKILNLKRQKFFKFIVFYFLLIVFTAALFFSFSRGAWLALAAGLIMMIALAAARGDLKSQKRLAEIVLVMSILLFVLFNQYQNLAVTRLTSQGRLEDKSNFERLVSFKESWRIIKKDWLIGVGPGNYTFVLSRARPEQASYYYQPAHNVFLLVFSEIGAGGLILFVGAIVLIFVRLLRFVRNDSRTATLITLIVLLSLDHWLFSLHFGGLFFWLVLGLVYGKKS